MSLHREVREQLLAGDAELRHLAEEHSRYEAELEQLIKSPYLNAEDILLEADLKKKKLRIKDEMERLIAQRTKSTHAH